MSKQQGFSPAKEVAEKNRDDFDRKWNFPSDRGKWEFEVKKGSEMTFELDDDGVYPTDKALEDISNFSLKEKTGREFNPENIYFVELPKCKMPHLDNYQLLDRYNTIIKKFRLQGINLKNE